MAKVFNVTADCKPMEHYMVDLKSRLFQIKELVDGGRYFTMNRARQYGKTTTLRALARFLQEEYYVVLMDFQTFGDAKFKNENTFALSFASSFVRLFHKNYKEADSKLQAAVACLKYDAEKRTEGFELKELFERLGDICDVADKRIVLMIDEVDSASNNQVFLDFLAQLRAYYINRDEQATFQSVILAGVYDVRNLRKKIRTEDAHKVNSPWNIAADFKIDMSFSTEEIAGMLLEYEKDYHTGMDVYKVAELLHEYTAGYPFLVSRLCKYMDEEAGEKEKFSTKEKRWTKEGFEEAVRLLLSEKNTLFESLIGKLNNYPELNDMLKELLFVGKSIVYNADNTAIDNATMLGFIKNLHGMAVVSNRIFEMRLYNYYLSDTEMQNLSIYKASLRDKSQFIANGKLDMQKILERFVIHFNDLYGGSNEVFLEEEGRKYFLLYLRPIINGTGNYYIESRTRGLGRTDVIVDYLGDQYVIELKIWRGEEYNDRGEKQLIRYLNDYHLNKGYMVSFNFNRKKTPGVHEIVIDGKKLIEAVV